MELNYLAQVAACRIDVPPLLYYSHISSAIIVLLLGLFVYFKNRKGIESRLLLVLAVFFSLWSISDIILWISVDVRLISFFWSLINAFEMLVSLTTLYFAYVFLEKKDVPLAYKFGGAMLILPYLFLIPTAYTIQGFDLALCEAVEGPALSYFYFFEVLISAWLLAYLGKKIVSSASENRKKVVYFSLGVLFFLLSFSGANIVASYTERWNILHYGLFGVPVFVGFLAYLIVRYRAFNVKLIGAQVLVLALIILVGSQFFFAKTLINQILTVTTFVLVSVFGWILMRSVQTEVERKEELQEMADRLAVTNEALKRLDNSKSEFISIASHQLRTPLTAIKGFLSLILEGSYGKITPQIEDVINKVYSANSHLVELVENLLNVSRIDSGRIQYQFAPADITEVIRELADSMAVIAKGRGLDISFTCPETPIEPFLMDAQKIREVLSNLIDNAIKYTREGGISVVLERSGDIVRIVVSDTGVGIAPEDLHQLFQKFRRGVGAGKVNVSGTGLGLYVGKSFVDAHGGTISVESEGVGKGSRFIVELPFRKK